MKPKNIMLLGFVNKAVEYLDKHMDEEPDRKLAELKNIDLASIRDELNDHLDASLGTMQSTMSTLLKAGNEAFDEFIETSLDKKSIPDQLDRLFDVDFDDTSKSNQDELIRLLSFYNLDDDFAFDEDQDIEPFEEDNTEEDEYMEEIRKNASTNDDTQDIVAVEHDDVDNKEIDDIFTEIIDNETKAQETETFEKDVEEVEETEEQPIEEYEPTIQIIENPAVDTVYEDLNQEELIEEVVQEEENTTVDEPVQEKVIETEEPTQENTEENDLDDYTSSLINELREQLLKEEEKKKAENKDKEIYERISNIYSHIPHGLVRSIYDLKDSIANEYPEEQNIVLLHRVKFDDVDNLRKFVEIGLNHGYTINADEKKMIVDIFKKFTNGDGKILNNIFEIANQGYVLDGTYEGYNVIPQDEE